MIVIAILLLAATAVVTAGVVFGGEQDATFGIFGETVRASAWEIFAIGVACGLAVPIALWLLTVGTRRAAVRRRETREMRAAHERERAEIAREREELEAERSKLRDGGGPVQPYVGPGSPEDRSTDRPPRAREPDSPDERSNPDRPDSPPARDTEYERFSGERETPTRFDVERPGVRPAGSGSPRDGLGTPPRTDGGFGVFGRPPRP